MKKQFLRLSEKITQDQALKRLDNLLSNHNNGTPEFQLQYKQCIAFINQLITKAQKVAQAGTTIHIKKEIMFEDVVVVLVLDSPPKDSLIEKIKFFFLGI